MPGSYSDCVDQLKELGYEFSSTYTGGGFRETWWKHPSGSKINLDEEPENPDANLRRVKGAPSSIIRHEFMNKVTPVVEALAESKGLVSERFFYLVDHTDGQDWHWNLTLRGNIIEGYRGKDLLPDEYAAVAEHFKRT